MRSVDTSTYVLVIVGLVIVLFVIRWLISTGVNKGANALENAHYRKKNEEIFGKPTLLALRYPEEFGVAAGLTAANVKAVADAGKAGVMFCDYCGKLLSEGASFCEKCGARVDPFESVAAAAACSHSDSGASHTESSMSQILPIEAEASGYTRMPSETPPLQGMADRKSNKTLYIVLAVVVAIGVAFAAFCIVRGVSQSKVSEDAVQSEAYEENTVSLSVQAADGETLTGVVRRDSNDYVLADSDTREYSIEELRAMGLTDAELCVAWNEPFARRGYHFKNQGLRDYFESCSWYQDENNSLYLTGVAATNNSNLRSIADENSSSAKWKSLASN